MLIFVVASISLNAWTERQCTLEDFSGLERFNDNNQRFCYGSTPTCYVIVCWRDSDGGEDLPPPPGNWTSIYFPQGGDGYIGILNHTRTPVNDEVMVTFDLSPLYIPVSSLEEIIDYYNNYSE